MRRLYGLGLQFGMSEMFGAVGTVSVMNSSPAQSLQTQRQGSISKPSLPFSLVASLPEGKSMSSLQSNLLLISIFNISFSVQ